MPDDVKGAEAEAGSKRLREALIAVNTQRKLLSVALGELAYAETCYRNDMAARNGDAEALQPAFYALVDGDESFDTPEEAAAELDHFEIGEVRRFAEMSPIYAMPIPVEEGTEVCFAGWEADLEALRTEMRGESQGGEGGDDDAF